MVVIRRIPGGRRAIMAQCNLGEKEESEVYLSAAVASASKYWLICLYGRKDKALAVLIRSAWQTSGNK